MGAYKSADATGVDDIIGHLNAAWSIDRHEMAQASIMQKGDGSTAVRIPIWPGTGNERHKIFEDESIMLEAFHSKYGYLEHTYAYRFRPSPIAAFSSLAGMVHTLNDGLLCPVNSHSPVE
jgi:hypothetical protein